MLKSFLLALVMLVVSAVSIAAVNINSATKEELDVLPGIGPVKAQAIIDYRNANGPFKTPEDIMKVKGIKEGEFGKIKDQISVRGATSAPAKAADAKTTAQAPAPKSEPAKVAPPAKESAPPPAPQDAKAAKAKEKEDKAAKAKADKEATAKEKEDKAAKAKADKEAKAKEAKSADAKSKDAKAADAKATEAKAPDAKAKQADPAKK